MKRNRTLVVVALVAAVALLVPTAVLAGTTNSPQAAVAVQAPPPNDAPSRDNFATVTYLHFGNPASGMAVIETWIRVTYDGFALPLTNQGGCRGIRVLNASRIALRCILHTIGGTTSSRTVTGPTVNSGDVGNPRIVSTATPVLGVGTDPGGTAPFSCRSWTEVHYAIRWADNTLSSGKVLVAPSTLFNQRCVP
jgi:hypothetical protein